MPSFIWFSIIIISTQLDDSYGPITETDAKTIVANKLQQEMPTYRELLAKELLIVSVGVGGKPCILCQLNEVLLDCTNYHKVVDIPVVVSKFGTLSRQSLQTVGHLFVEFHTKGV